MLFLINCPIKVSHPAGDHRMVVHSLKHFTRLNGCCIGTDIPSEVTYLNRIADRISSDPADAFFVSDARLNAYLADWLI